MTDSLTASMKWCRYDDDFKEKNGFRLPAGKAFSRNVSCVARHFAGVGHPIHVSYCYYPSLDLQIAVLTPTHVRPLLVSATARFHHSSLASGRRSKLPAEAYDL